MKILLFVICFCTFITCFSCFMLYKIHKECAEIIDYKIDVYFKEDVNFLNESVSDVDRRIDSLEERVDSVLEILTDNNICLSSKKG